MIRWRHFAEARWTKAPLPQQDHHSYLHSAHSRRQRHVARFRHPDVSSFEGPSVRPHAHRIRADHIPRCGAQFPQLPVFIVCHPDAGAVERNPVRVLPNVVRHDTVRLKLQRKQPHQRQPQRSGTAGGIPREVTCKHLCSEGSSATRVTKVPRSLQYIRE